MKRILLSLTAVLISAMTFAQAPESFKYQAVVRDVSSNILANQAVGVQIIIHQTSPTGTAVYTETFAPTTNGYGLINLEIGTGTTTDDFTAINWGAGPYFIETAIDPTGGTTYSSMGTSQLVSVPYALHAGVADSIAGGGSGGGNWLTNGTDIYNANQNNIGIRTTSPLYDFTVTDTVAEISVGNFGSFNDINSGRLIFNEDVDYTGGICGIDFQYNGSSNNLHLRGGCSTLDTIARFSRNGQTNIQQLRVGTNILQNATNALDVDGDVTISGNLTVTGTLSKGGGTFRIDHPTDPANKYLVHSFVESPEMMNVYSGNITTDANGFATVELPDYFQAANKDFRYQLTVIGSFAQAIVKEKINGNTFIVQTNQPNIEVSWQVTGVRADKWAEANRIQPEEEKEVSGTYIHPDLYDAPASKSVLNNVPQQEENKNNADGQ